MPGSPVHLARRFVDVLAATPLTAEEISSVASWTSDAEARLFFAQGIADQRHGYEAALFVVGSMANEPRTIKAALLHDVGKRHSHLGVFRRSIASILIKLGLPMTAAMRMYRDHGPIAADELSAIGSDPLVVDFARNHHGRRPQSIDLATWSVLSEADEPPKAKLSIGGPVSWRTR